MKKSILTKSFLAAGFLGLALVSSAASANSFSHCRFYVGAGADYNLYNLGVLPETVLLAPGISLKADGAGFLPLIGVKFHQHFGIEGGYSWNKKITFSHPALVDESSYKVKNMYVDLIGFIPVHKHVEVLGGLGFSKLNVKQDVVTLGVKEIDNKFNWRAKVGVNYHVHKNLGIRAVDTYQEVCNKVKTNNLTIAGAAIFNGTKFIKNLKSIGVALTYNF